MNGERLHSADLSTRGIPGDRGWAVYDEARNGITNGKRWAAMRRCNPHYVSEPVPGQASPPISILLPNGVRVDSSASAAASQMTEWLGRPVSLRALGPAGSESARRLTMQDERPEVVRELMGVLPGEPMADLSELPPERLRLLRQGNFFDAFPIHLLTRTTLRTLARIAPESNWDERRFRPNLLLDVNESQGYPELAWTGRSLRAGSAVLEVVTGCPRCVMVTQAVDDLAPDPGVIRTLVRETHHVAGVYARVAESGHVRVGDPVEMVT